MPYNIKMTNDELTAKWLSAFCKNIDKELLEKYVTSNCNFLWHLFSWNLVPCIEGNEARMAFNELQYTEAIKFYSGYSGQIDDVSVISKVTAAQIDKERTGDVYIAATDFSWTYVRTHEIGMCGPYLCRRIHVLSVDGVYYEMFNPKTIKSAQSEKQYESIEVEWQTKDFKSHTETFTGRSAQIVGHAIDGCDGTSI